MFDFLRKDEELTNYLERLTPEGRYLFKIEEIAVIQDLGGSPIRLVLELEATDERNRSRYKHSQSLAVYSSNDQARKMAIAFFAKLVTFLGCTTDEQINNCEYKDLKGLKFYGTVVHNKSKTRDNGQVFANIRDINQA